MLALKLKALGKTVENRLFIRFHRTLFDLRDSWIHAPIVEALLDLSREATFGFP